MKISTSKDLMIVRKHIVNNRMRIYTKSDMHINITIADIIAYIEANQFHIDYVSDTEPATIYTSTPLVGYKRCRLVLNWNNYTYVTTTIYYKKGWI